jgi:hypothetical protein
MQLRRIRARSQNDVPFHSISHPFPKRERGFWLAGAILGLVELSTTILLASLPTSQRTTSTTSCNWGFNLVVPEPHTQGFNKKPRVLANGPMIHHFQGCPLLTSRGVNPIKRWVDEKWIEMVYQTSPGAGSFRSGPGDSSDRDGWSHRSGRFPGSCPEDPAQSEGPRLQWRLCRVRGPMGSATLNMFTMGCPQHKPY